MSIFAHGSSSLLARIIARSDQQGITVDRIFFILYLIMARLEKY
ncbi:hypothetical protein LRHK_1824 [Lacticaseibacillus rhamnosus ATCC 8530]|nr:hypothetical protein LRHK_1824 [Lacticaseibacillus rhamnosus ATCC 8530]